MTKPGVYRHYKGNFYRVSISTVQQAYGVDRKPIAMTVYTGIACGKTYVRPEAEFHEAVCPDDRNLVSRFEWVGE